MTLKVEEARRGGWSVLRLSGELDLVSSHMVRQQTHEAVAAGRRHVVLDLSEVQFCDSSGVGVLIAARRLLHSCGGRLRLVLPARGPVGSVEPSHVHRVLGALGVRRLFDVHESTLSATSPPVKPAPQPRPVDAKGPTAASASSGEAEPLSA